MRNKGNGFICVGLLFIAAALFLANLNVVEEKKAEQVSEQAFTILEEKIVEDTKKYQENIKERVVPDYLLNPNMDMPTEEIDGKSYIGILQIPSLELELPIIDTWDYDSLKTAPCRYSGSAYTDRFSICAHNYRSHFGRIKEMHIGDRLTFTDIDGNVFQYEVIDMETISASDAEALQEGEGNLLLFTCTISGQNRFLVRCKYV